MIRATVRWIGTSAALLFIVTVLTFVLAALAPGDAARSILESSHSTYTSQQYQDLRHQLGIDQPLPAQYWHWLYHLLHGSLGTDLFSGEPIASALSGRLAATLSLAIGGVIVSAVVGIAVGIFSAIRRGPAARAVSLVSLLGMAVPGFWLALVVVELLAIRVRAFPATGYTPFTEDPQKWLQSIVLPVLSLSFGASATIARQVRDSMSEVLAQDYITALRARGVPLRSIILKHALRNAAIPLVTMLGLLLVGLLGGTVLIESIFAIPGLGQQAVTASSTHDLPMIEGVAFFFTLVVIVVNLLVDVSYRWLNPKVRLS